MNIKFKPQIAIIYDFLRVIVAKCNDIRFMDEDKKTTLEFSIRARQAYKHIWEGIETDVAGLTLFFSKNNHNSKCYMYHLIDKRIHEFDSINLLLTEVFDRPSIDIQIALLKFLDTSHKEDDYYINLIRKPGLILTHLNSLDISDKMRLEFITFIYNPDEILESVKKFCNKVRIRLNHVYKRHSEEIREFNKYISSKIKVSPDDFINNEILPLFMASPNNNLENYIISYSFINELVITRYSYDTAAIIIVGFELKSLQENNIQKDLIINYDLLLKALADRNRLQIITYLSKEEMCVSDIASKVGIAFTTTSYHLDVLFSAGILLSRTAGKKIYYGLNEKLIIEKLLAFTNALKRGKHYEKMGNTKN